MNVSETKIADIETGQKVEITGNGFKNNTYYGKVKSIGSEAKQVVTTSGQENVVEVVVTIQEPGRGYKARLFCKGKNCHF